MPKAKQTATPAPTGGESLRLLSEQTAYELNGHTYALSMTHRVILHWEQVTGLSFFVDLGKVFDRPSLKALSAMLFCLVAAAGYEGSLEDIQAHLFKAANLRPACVAINAAYLAAQVQPDVDADPPPPMPAK